MYKAEERQTEEEEVQMTSLADIEIFMSEVHKDCKRCPVRFECNENDFVDFDCEDVLEHMKRKIQKEKKKR